MLSSHPWTKHTHPCRSKVSQCLGVGCSKCLAQNQTLKPTTTALKDISHQLEKELKVPSEKEDMQNLFLPIQALPLDSLQHPIQLQCLSLSTSWVELVCRLQHHLAGAAALHVIKLYQKLAFQCKSFLEQVVSMLSPGRYAATNYSSKRTRKAGRVEER